MRLAWLIVAGCAVDPQAAGWAGRWSDGFHPLVVEACDRKPFLAIEWNDMLLVAQAYGGRAVPCYACANAWEGALLLDGDVLHVSIGDLAFDAARVGSDDGDQDDCPSAF